MRVICCQKCQYPNEVRGAPVTHDLTKHELFAALLWRPEVPNGLTNREQAHFLGLPFDEWRESLERNHSPRLLAHLAVRHADALLAELEKKP